MRRLAILWGGVVALQLAVGCTPKTATPSPSATPISRFGPTPAAELASLPVHPRSGTWEVSGKFANEKVVPFKVILEFQPDGLIAVNGRLKTAEEAKKEPYNRSYISQTTTIGQTRTTVTLQIGGQYTLTLMSAELLEGPALVRGEQLATVQLKWLNESTAIGS